MNKSTECKQCHWRYPAQLLDFLRNSTGEAVCGICALELSNRIHKLNRKKFAGPLAESLRLEAINWRARHPDLAPKEKTHAQ